MTEKLKFVGRAFELDYLDRQYQEAQGSLCVVYGRRRIGKTRLLTHWLEHSGMPGFYWVATDSSPAILLRSLSHAVYEQIHGAPPAEADYTYYDWNALTPRALWWTISLSAS